jgi:hypothetical protein
MTSTQPARRVCGLWRRGASIEEVAQLMVARDEGRTTSRSVVVPSERRSETRPPRSCRPRS